VLAAACVHARGRCGSCVCVRAGGGGVAACPCVARACAVSAASATARAICSLSHVLPARHASCITPLTFGVWHAFWTGTGCCRLQPACMPHRVGVMTALLRLVVRAVWAARARVLQACSMLAQLRTSTGCTRPFNPHTACHTMIIRYYSIMHGAICLCVCATALRVTS
jgi:hypothetical protein